MTFNPNAQAAPFIQIAGPNVQVARHVTALNPTLKHPHTDAERIASARARGKAGTKANNLPGAKFGMQISAEWFQDGAAGPQTSAHDFKHLLFVLGFLRDTRFQLDLPYVCHDYSPRTGICASKPPVSIWDLRLAVENRCAELGISLALLEEWLAVPHTIVEDKEFHSLTFEQKMLRFKQAQ